MWALAAGIFRNQAKVSGTTAVGPRNLGHTEGPVTHPNQKVKGFKFHPFPDEAWRPWGSSGPLRLDPRVCVENNSTSCQCHADHRTQIWEVSNSVPPDTEKEQRNFFPVAVLEARTQGLIHARQVLYG